MEQSRKTHQCEICKKWYASPSTLKVHQKLHQGIRERNFKCSVCDKSFFTIQICQQHENTHNAVKEFRCDVCDRSFSNNNYLKNHVKDVHSGEKSYQCAVCNKTFARKAELQNHERIHSGERPFHCQICRKTFSQRSNLQTHIKTTHMGEKKFKCLICGTTYNRQRLLDFHINVKHTNVKPLKCLYCDNRFVYPQAFKKHMQNCESKPQANNFLEANDQNKQYVVKRIGSNYYIVDANEHLDALNINLEQNYQENEIIIDNNQDNMVPLQGTIDINYPPDQHAVFLNDSALIELRTGSNENEQRTKEDTSDTPNNYELDFDECLLREQNASIREVIDVQSQDVNQWLEDLFS